MGTQAMTSIELIQHCLSQSDQLTEDLRFLFGTTAQHEEGCICFPAGEDLCFNSVESRAAEELRCPLHGQRIPAGVYSTYRAAWRGNEREDGWSNHSLQYERAMAATYEYSEDRL
jgi:hypothetical protein